MNRLHIGATAIAAAGLTISTEAAAQQQCAGLLQQYRSEIDTASRYAALNQALGEDSTAANEARESNALSRARMAREALSGARCRSPALTPSPGPYMPSARRCRIDSIMSRYGGGLPSTCDPARWSRSR